MRLLKERPVGFVKNHSHADHAGAERVFRGGERLGHERMRSRESAMIDNWFLSIPDGVRDGDAPRCLFRLARRYKLSIASPPALLHSARQTPMATLFEIQRVEPSHMTALTPPGWRLREAIIVGVLAVATRQGGFSGLVGSHCPPE